MEGSLLWAGLAMGLMAPMAMAQTAPTPAPVIGGETQALVDRLVSEGLAARDQKIADLERRIEKLEATKSTAPAPAADVSAPSNGAEHVIAEGETLRRIAQIHGVTPEALASENNMSVSQLIYPGKKLRIPGKAASASPAPAVAGAGSYVVKEGDTLTSIARAHSTTVDELKRLNGISNAAYITVGSTLRVSGTAAPASSAPAPVKTSAKTAAPVEEQYHYYPVAAGDTLGSIAKNFFTTVEELVRLNKFPSSNVTLSAGQEVIVPTKKYFEAMRGGNTVG